MWTRAELKLRAKSNLRKYFWPALAVSMINSLFNSNGGSSAGSGANAGANASQELNINVSEIINGDLGAVISDIPQAAEGIIESFDPVTTTILLVGVVIGLAVSLVLGVFVAPVVEVGKNRFYLESRQLGRASGMECLIWGFKNHYLNIIWTMLIRGILVVLGTFFFVIPGIYLSYCYYMVPYILAENPDMRTSDALRMSKDMMQGHKLSTWVLSFSFIGWWVLGALACGVGTFLVYPYYDATFAELYAVLRNPYTNYLGGFGKENTYENTYEYKYEQPTNTEPAANTQTSAPVDHAEADRSGGNAGRGYYLNGVFYPYTDEELKELEKNGY